jgi:hypothetical protein
VSPLVSSPNRGYDDYQRITNFDTNILVSQDTGVGHPHIFGPIIDVSRYAYVGISNTEILSQHVFALSWFTDLAGDAVLGLRQFGFDAAILQSAQMRIVNLGPFVAPEWINNGAVNYHAQTQLFASNRVYPTEFVPHWPNLVDKQGIAIGAGGTDTVYPTDYYSGPAHVSVYGNVAGLFVSLQYLNIAFAWRAMETFQSTSITFLTTYATILPAGAWRLFVSNPGAAGNYSVIVTPSTTGSS